MRPPAFLIVGTPRSGTTLIQRLAAELEGVRVPPESHFFTEFAAGAVKRWPPPLAGRALEEALGSYAGRRYIRDVPFDVDEVVSDLGGRCDSLLDLYRAIVGHLAGTAPFVGEKTPGHLLWWRPLTRALAGLKVVAVVRDPRAVVASWLEVGWTHHHARPAQRWRDDVRRIAAASTALGPERLLLLCYEQAVADPDATRAQIATFIAGSGSAPGLAETRDDAPRSVPSWETWKERALGPIDPARVDRWRERLTERQNDDVRAICRAGMASLGYDDLMDRGAAVWRRLTFPPGMQLRRLRLGARRLRREAEIARISRGWTPSHATGESDHPAGEAGLPAREA